MVTVTSTVPVPAGLSAVIVVSSTTVTSVAAVVPKFDRRGAGEARARDRHDVPPAAGPLVGLMPVTVGRNRSVGELIGGRRGRRARRRHVPSRPPCRCPRGWLP